MRTRLLLLLFTVLVLGAAGGGTWFMVRRTEDPHQRALVLAGRGELRGVLIEQRNEVASHPGDPAARLRLADTLAKLYDFPAAEKTYRGAEAAGAPHVDVALGLAQVAMSQGAWNAMLDDLPPTGPNPALTARIMQLRGTAQLGMKQTETARATLAALDRAAPDGIDANLLGARLARATQDGPAERTRLDAILRTQPDQPDALAMKLRMEALPDPASLALADRAEAAMPWSIDVRLMRANLLMLARQNDKARMEVDWVRARYPGVPAGNYLHAVLLIREQKLPEAAAVLEKMGRSADLFPRALFLQAAIASATGARESAVELARRYNARYPADRSGVMLLARTELMQQRPADAVPLLQKALADGNGTQDPALLQLLGAAYAGLGQQADAFRVRQEAAAAAPDDPGVLTGLGVSQLDRGDTAAGIDTLQRSARLAPIQPAVNDRLFGAAVGAGDLPAATEALARRRAQEGESEPVRGMEALMLLADGDLAGAKAGMEAVIRDFPNSTLAKVNYAKLLFAQGQRPEADAMLAAVLANDPGNVQALSAGLQAWIAAKDFARANAAVDAAVAAAPADPRYTAMRSDVLLRSGDPKAAIKVLDERRVGGRLPPGLLPFLARAQIASGDKPAAVATYAAMVEQAPKAIEVRLEAAALLSQEKRLDEAKAVLRSGLVQTPGTFGLMAALVTLELRGGGLDAALASARALRAEPRNMPAAALLEGDVLMQAKRYGAAAKSFQAEYEAAPSQILALRVAAAESADGHADQAASVVRQWLAGHPGDPDTIAALAALDIRARRWDEAVPLLEARLARRPNEAAAMNDLAWAYQQQHDPRALPLAQRAFKSMPVPQVADTLGWILLNQGDVPGALALLQPAYAKLPANPALAYHLALALQKDGRPAEGLKLLQPLLAQPAAFDDRPAAEALAKDIQKAL